MSDISVTVTGPAPLTVRVTGATGIAPTIRSGDTFRVQLAGVGPTGPQGAPGSTTIAGASDVVLTDLANGDVLRFSNNRFRNFRESDLSLDGGNW